MSNQAVLQNIELSLGVTFSDMSTSYELVSNGGEKYYLEILDSGSLILLHTSLEPIKTRLLDKSQLRHLLHLNKDAELMKKSWLVVNPIEQSPRVCVSVNICLLYTSPSPRDLSTSRMPSSA